VKDVLAGGPKKGVAKCDEHDEQQIFASCQRLEHAMDHAEYTGG